MTVAEGTLQPWKPDPGQAEGGWPPPGPWLPLPLTVPAWLGTGTAMAGLNKWIFTTHGFRCPLLLSSLHMLSGVAVGWAQGCSPPALRPRAGIHLLSLTSCASVATGNLGLSHVQLDVVQAVATDTSLVTQGCWGATSPGCRRSWRRGCLCHRRQAQLLPAQLQLPPGRHRPVHPQVHPAE